MSTTSVGETLSPVSTQPPVAVTVTVTYGGGGGGGGGGGVVDTTPPECGVEFVDGPDDVEDTPDPPGWDEEEDWLTDADEDGVLGVTGVVGDVIRVGDG